MPRRPFGMRRLTVLALAYMCGCASIGRHHSVSDLPPDCPGPPAMALDFEPDDWAALAGTFRLTTVLTSQGGTPQVWRETLTMQRTDSATRYARRSSINPRSERGDRPLIGTSGTETPGDRPAPTEYEAGRIYIGCRLFQCTDASPLVYHLEWQTPDRFGGSWRDYQTGIGRVVGSHGQPLPDPAGHFCGARLPPRRDP